MELNEITGAVVNSALGIHRALGPGLLESVYQRVLARDLRRLGFYVETQKEISFEYEGMWFENAFSADLVVERTVVVEIKSVQSIAPVHEKQLLTYLRLLDYPVGLLLNFNEALMKDGIRRIAHRV